MATSDPKLASACRVAADLPWLRDMQSLPFICAVTLNWNRPQDTITCLASLSEQTYPNLKLVVVDNGSSDDSANQIRAAFPEMTLIANATNQGFARGMNAGIRYALAAGAEHVFVLNNDTFLAPDALSRLVAQAEEGVGLLAPAIYYADAPQQIWSLGGQIHSGTLETVATARGQIDKGQWPAVLQRDFVPGCAMLLSRAALQEAGLFDECFFMYYEDLDLCLRLRRAGYRIVVVTRSKMWHKIALSSGGGGSPNERYWTARSSVRYFARHAQWWQWPIIIFWRTGSAARTTWRLLRQGKNAALKGYWQGLWHGLGELKQ